MARGGTGMMALSCSHLGWAALGESTTCTQLATQPLNLVTLPRSHLVNNHLVNNSGNHTQSQHDSEGLL